MSWNPLHWFKRSTDRPAPYVGKHRKNTAKGNHEK